VIQLPMFNGAIFCSTCQSCMSPATALGRVLPLVTSQGLALIVRCLSSAYRQCRSPSQAITLPPQFERRNLSLELG
jgi:hypothetical protein